MREALRELLAHPGVRLGGGTGGAPVNGVVPSGWAELDALLPGGGWPVGAVTEVLVCREGTGEVRFLLPAVAQAGREGRWIAWIDPPYVPYAPALSASGLPASRILVVRARAERDRLWAAEQCLRSGACGAVLAWSAGGDDRALRRLQLAAEKGRCLGFLFRGEDAAGRASPVPLRLRVGPSRGGVVVEILKGPGAGRSAKIPLGRRPEPAEAGAESESGGCFRPKELHA